MSQPKVVMPKVRGPHEPPRWAVGLMWVSGGLVLVAMLAVGGIIWKKNAEAAELKATVERQAADEEAARRAAAEAAKKEAEEKIARAAAEKKAAEEAVAKAAADKREAALAAADGDSSSKKGKSKRHRSRSRGKSSVASVKAGEPAKAGPKRMGADELDKLLSGLK